MRILLFQPLYSRQADIGSSGAYYNAKRQGSPHQVVGMAATPNSVLPDCFNEGWVAARDGFEAGQFDAFAMIHADVVTVHGWIDDLVGEMEGAGVDLLSVVIPLKNQTGLTSTGLDYGHKWFVRRLAMKEVRNELPGTFDSAFGMPLLLNTGLWICKLGPWCLETAFRFETDIIRAHNGKWRRVGVGEDLGFSRQCRALGVTMAATSKIPVHHMDGNIAYSNQEAWGWETDREWKAAEEAGLV